jgi:hypothetical protein
VLLLGLRRPGSIVIHHGVDRYRRIEGTCWWRFGGLGGLANLEVGEVVHEGGVRMLLVRHECCLFGDSSGMLRVLGDEKVDEGLLRRNDHV